MFSRVYRKRYWQHTVNLYRVLRSCLKTFNVYILNYSYCKKKGNAKWKSQRRFLYTKIYHTYHTFILIWYLLFSVVTVLSEHARLLAFSSQFWLRHRHFLHVTIRKAYCKQLNPHSFLQNSNKQTNQNDTKKQKAYFLRLFCYTTFGFIW